MKIIILKDIKKIGKQGDVADVKDGYARNYLIPNGFALVADKDNMQRLEKIRKTRMLMENKEHNEALRIKERLDNTSITLTVEAKEDDEIYGSINETHIVKALKEEGFELERKQIKLDAPIKKLGAYSLDIKLYTGIESKLRVWIVKK
ncbi:MAG: 50S ribosomal protein L9 [Candidatus Omnitrophica bacterium 4484_171]|nr:MAG: 50S ribosomal protein L9 [Candidatus Omnitrophica bacterium 4484_171]